MNETHKPKRKVKTSAEKPKRGPSVSNLAKQVSEIQRLLLVWPTAPAKAVEQFVEDTLGVTLTRVCLQEAKETLGLHKPEYTENTVKKKALAEYAVCNLARFYGVAGLSEDQYCSRVTKTLKACFGETTHGRLIKQWVTEQLVILKPSIQNPSLLHESLAVAKDKIESLGIHELATNQLELL